MTSQHRSDFRLIEVPTCSHRSLESEERALGSAVLTGHLISTQIRASGWERMGLNGICWDELAG